MLKIRSTLVLLFFAVAPLALAQDILRPTKVDTPPTIDGVLDEPMWQEIPYVTGFKTFVPDFEKDMGHETHVFMAYDEDNLYFAFKAFDDPGLIKTSVAARDRIRDDDWICINLDSFNDQQSLYGFYVNPNGIQMDSKFAAGRDDLGIDMVWYSAGQINDEGYFIEVQIPFKSIRYRNGDIVSMGVVFERKISRLSIQGTYPALDPSMGFNFVMQTKQMDYEGIRKFTLLEVLPAVTYANRSTHQEGEMKNDVNRADFGVTAKYGITSDLILDATINPDFSQVESDVGQVDINQRFPIFFPERRPFFLEGNEYFNFAQTGGRDAVRSVVNTRSIVNPLLATKLTGRIGQKNQIASIFAMDEIPRDEVASGTEKNAKVGVLRYKRSFTNDSYIGAVYTGRDLNGYFNRVGGIDAQIRLDKASTIEGNYLHSWSKDSIGLPVQDAHSMKFGYNRRTRDMSIGASFADLNDFRSDVGFVTRTEARRYNLWLSPKFYFDHDTFKRFEPAASITYLLDKPSGLYEHSYWFNFQLAMIRNSRLSFNYNVKTEVYRAEIFDRDNIRASVESQINKRVFFDVSYRYGGKIFYSDTPFQGDGEDISAQLNLQVNDNFNSEWRYTYSNFKERETKRKEYDYSIIRSRNTYQVNKYLFFRLIVQYNAFREELNTDFLASFTYIPGTVVHLGYGTVYNNTRWEVDEYVPGDRLIETARGVFFKASYLFRK